MKLDLNRFEAVIFDMDGTMIDNTPFHSKAWLEFCKRHGIELTKEEYHQKISGRSNDVILANLFGRRLVIGKEINADDMEKILSEAEVGKLVEKVYGLLNVRYRSEREIRDYMKQLSFKRKIKEQDELSEVVIEALIEKLKKRDLINDLRFAKEWVEARRKSKKKGVNALKSELFQKGIDREIVEEVLSDEAAEGMDEGSLAKEALEKKMRSWKNLPEPELKQKAIQFLMRKGFNYDIAKEVLENYLKEGV